MGNLMIPVCCVCGKCAQRWHDPQWETDGGLQDFCPTHASQYPELTQYITPHMAHLGSFVPFRGKGSPPKAPPPRISQDLGEHSPRDWPEDFPHENGNYLCRCVLCKHPFNGHKRRVICRACHVSTSAEMDRRERVLVEDAKLLPGFWVLLTVKELARERAQYSDLLLQLHAERRVMEKLTTVADDLLFQIECSRTMGCAGFSTSHPMLADLRAAVKAAKLVGDCPAQPEGSNLP